MVSMHFKSYYKFAGGYYGTNIKAEINLKKKVVQMYRWLEPRYLHVVVLRGTIKPIIS